MADNIAWNKVWGEVKDKDDVVQSYGTDYQNTLSAVGDSMYCNFVSGGLYGLKYSDIKNHLKRMGVWTHGSSSSKCAVMGLGGTTALLYLDNDSIDCGD